MALALALFIAACGGSDSEGTDEGPDPSDAPSSTVDSGGDGTTSGDCRLETIEDEYGFEVEIEVCGEDE